MSSSLPYLPTELWVAIVQACDPPPRRYQRLCTDDLKRAIALRTIARAARSMWRPPEAGSVVALYARRGPDLRRPFAVGRVVLCQGGGEEVVVGGFRVETSATPNVRTYFFDRRHPDPRFRIRVLRSAPSIGSDSVPNAASS
jgi:hypothetical protein